jgi:TPR repeat protein/ankyrin repeat protein
MRLAILISVFLIAVQGCALTEKAAGDLEKLAGSGDKASLAKLQSEAEAGNPAAQLTIGRLLSSGKGVPRDDANAFAWFLRAAEQGNARAQANVGTFVYYGRGTKKDAEAAIPWWTKAADARVALAQIQLGIAYLSGTGVPKDRVKGAHWIDAATRQDDPAAMLLLARAYFAGNGVERDAFAGNMALRTAAAKNYAPAQTQLAQRILRKDAGEHPDEAIRLLRKAAAQEDPEGQHQLGEVYRHGKFVEKDTILACDWFAKAATLGYAPAIYESATCLLQREFSAANRAKARAMMEIAAKSGSSAAKMTLRIMPQWPNSPDGGSAQAGRQPPQRIAPGARNKTNESGAEDLLPTDSIPSPASLFKACSDGNIADVRRILAAGIPIDVVNDSVRGDRQTALHHAMRAKASDIAALLIRRGIAVNAAAKSGYTALHIAAGLGRLEHVKLLLAHGANVRALDSRGEPLHAAVVEGKVKVVELLLAAGANPDARIPVSQDTPLTVLNYVTLWTTHDEIVRQLVAAGADINARNAYGRRPIQAMPRAKEHTAILLLDRGAETKDLLIDGNPIVFAFAAAGHTRVLARLLSSGHAIDARSRYGSTLLHHAAALGTDDVVTWLIGKGADVNAKSTRGGTPLHNAASRRAESTMVRLLEAGADPNAIDDKGQTPGFALLAVPGLATYNLEGTARMVSILRKHGANFDAMDSKGVTPLNWFVANTYLSADHDVPPACEVAYQVAMASGQVNSRNRNGDGPLHSLAGRGYFSVMEYVLPPFARCLIRIGADLDARNDANETPMDVAAKNRDGAGRYLLDVLAAQPSR